MAFSLKIKQCRYRMKSRGRQCRRSNSCEWQCVVRKGVGNVGRLAELLAGRLSHTPELSRFGSNLRPLQPIKEKERAHQKQGPGYDDNP